MIGFERDGFISVDEKVSAAVETGFSLNVVVEEVVIVVEALLAVVVEDVVRDVAWIQ